MEERVWDYVIVQELLHFFVPNHSKRWMSLKRAYLGEYEPYEAEHGTIQTASLSILDHTIPTIPKKIIANDFFGYVTAKAVFSISRDSTVSTGRSLILLCGNTHRELPG
jgi:hypothetical protein